MCRRALYGSRRRRASYDPPVPFFQRFSPSIIARVSIPWKAIAPTGLVRRTRHAFSTVLPSQHCARVRVAIADAPTGIMRCTIHIFITVSPFQHQGGDRPVIRSGELRLAALLHPPCFYHCLALHGNEGLRRRASYASLSLFLLTLFTRHAPTGLVR